MGDVTPAAPPARSGTSGTSRRRLALLVVAGVIALWLLGTWAHVLPDYLSDALSGLIPALADGDLVVDAVERAIMFTLALVAWACAAATVGPRTLGLRGAEWTRQGRVTLWAFWAMTFLNVVLSIAQNWYLIGIPQLGVGFGFAPGWWQLAAYGAGAAEEIVAIGLPVALMRMAAERLPYLQRHRRLLGWLGVGVLVLVRVSYHLWLGSHVLAVAVVAFVEVLLYRRFRLLLPLMVAHCAMDAVMNLPALWPFVLTASPILAFLTWPPKSQSTKG